jgi:ribosomal protein S7
MSAEFVTIKISKDTFEQLREYRDKNNLKSMSAAIQNGVDCISAIEETQKRLEEHKEKQEYYEIQDKIIKKLIENTLINWLETVDEKKAADSIRYALQSFKEIKKDPSFEVFENKDRIIREVFEKYIKIITSNLEKTKFKSEIKHRISALFLEQLLTFDENI